MIDKSGAYFTVVWALLVARTKEYYRDRGALIWSFVFPACVIAAIAIAFSEDAQEVLRIGVYQPEDSAALDLQLLDEPFVKRIHYVDMEQALERVRLHQLDLLLSAEQPGAYWINELSNRGLAAEQLLLGEGRKVLLRQSVSGREVRYVDWVIPGVLGMNVMFGALFGIGFVIVRYRKNGVLKRLQVTPVTRMQFLMAQVMSRLLVLLIGVILVYIGCNLVLDFVMLGNYPTLLLVAFLGIFSLISLALIVASRTASEELANGLLNFAAFPMMLLSEVWFSLDDAPHWLVWVSQCMPLTHLVQGAREIMIDGATFADVSNHVWTLLAMCVVFLVTATLLFRWNEQ